MKGIYRYLFLLCLTAACFQAAVAKHPDKSVSELSADGPYILYDSTGGMRMIRVDGERHISDSFSPSVPADFSFPVVSHDGKHRFEVKLHPFKRPAWKTPLPGKLLVLSDPHGNLECLVSVLRNNGVIDSGYHWTFGNNQLVIIGDIFDRGKDVVQIFWLVYKLEEEARKAGGTVTFTLGNHEEMILRGDCRYAKAKYKELADSLNMPYQDLWRENSELGRWLRTRNLIQIAGDNLIVHAGLSEEFRKRKETIPRMNETAGRGLSLDREERRKISPLSAFIFDTKTWAWPSS